MSAFSISLFAGAGVDVCGIHLHPFSCWHAAVLDQFSNPLWHGGEATLEDILAAGWVMTTVFADRVLVTDHDFVTGGCEQFAKQVKHAGDVSKVVSSIRGNLDDCTESPKFWSTGGLKVESGVPGWFSLAAGVMRHYHVDEDRAWDMPVSLASCYMAAVAESNGAKLMSETQAKIIDNIKASGLKWEG